MIGEIIEAIQKYKKRILIENARDLRRWGKDFENLKFKLEGLSKRDDDLLWELRRQAREVTYGLKGFRKLDYCDLKQKVRLYRGFYQIIVARLNLEWIDNNPREAKWKYMF